MTGGRTLPVRVMKMIEALKNRNRTLLEMQAGMLFFGLVCQAGGFLFADGQKEYALALWFGVAFAFAGSIHMCRTLERALSCGEDAGKIVVRGYLLRYAMVCLALVLVALTGVMNPLVFFLGYMSLKVAAYIQPFTHKLCNKLFHETDPVPEPSEEEPVPGGEKAGDVQSGLPSDKI